MWHSLAEALENSEDTHDFLEYRYCASLRHTLSQALLHLLSLSQSQDMPTLGASLAGEAGRGVREHLVKYLLGEVGGEVVEGPEGEKEAGDVERPSPRQRILCLRETLNRLKELRLEEEGDHGAQVVVLDFLEDLLKSCEELKADSST